MNDQERQIRKTRTGVSYSAEKGAPFEEEVLLLVGFIVLVEGSSRVRPCLYSAFASVATMLVLATSKIWSVNDLPISLFAASRGSLGARTGVPVKVAGLLSNSRARCPQRVISPHLHDDGA